MTQNKPTIIPTENNEDIITETQTIAHRLNELGFHDESQALFTKAQELATGKLVLSSVALQYLVDESLVLSDLAYEVRKLYSNSRPYNVTRQIQRLLSEAIVEVVILNGGVIDSRQAEVITAHKMKVALSLMRAAILIARQDGKLKTRSDKRFTLQIP